MAWYKVKRPIDPKESAVDLALLAYILKGAAPFYGRIKLQKTTFLTELRLRERGLTGPRFRFYRYNNGPFSKDLLLAYELLHAQGLALHRDSPGLTERGQMLADFAQMLRDESDNRELFDEIDPVLKHCKKRNGAELMHEVYGLVVRPEDSTESLKVRDIPSRADIIVPTGSPTLHVPEDLLALIIEALEVTDEQLAEGRRQMPEILESFIRAVMIDRPQSA